jgi:hypothetical protein
MAKNKKTYANVVSFSGGQSSGEMLRRLIDRHADFRERFIVVFENTGKEHDATLDFVHRVETEWAVPIIWLQYKRIDANAVPIHLVKEGKTQTYHRKLQEKGAMAHWFDVVNYETAARKGDKWTPFDDLLAWASVLPNVVARLCSVQLKVRTRDRYLYSVGIRHFNSFIGIRADEQDRQHEILCNLGEFEMPHFPLVVDGVIKADVNAAWDARPFKLTIPNRSGNCEGCFLKTRAKRVLFAREQPQAAQWYLDWEAKRGATTHGDGGVFDRKKENSWASIIADAQNPYFVVVDDEEDIPCSCAVGGYRDAKADDEQVEDPSQMLIPETV